MRGQRLGCRTAVERLLNVRKAVNCREQGRVRMSAGGSANRLRGGRHHALPGRRWGEHRRPSAAEKGVVGDTSHCFTRMTSCYTFFLQIGFPIKKCTSVAGPCSSRVRSRTFTDKRQPSHGVTCLEDASPEGSLVARALRCRRVMDVTRGRVPRRARDVHCWTS